jgi:hypothetical protein
MFGSVAPGRQTDTSDGRIVFRTDYGVTIAGQLLWMLNADCHSA